MSGDVNFFATSLVDRNLPDAEAECLRLIGRRCPSLKFVDRHQGRFVRVTGGEEPRIEELSTDAQLELTRTIESVAASSEGGLETTPTSWIVDINTIGHVFVPGPVGPLATDASYMLDPVSPECCIAPLEELKTHLEELLECDEESELEPDARAFMKRLVGYVGLAQKLELALVVRYV
jgi:hypothetical protein